MPIVISSLPFHPCPPKKVLRWAKEVGFSGMEFLCEPPWHPEGWSTEERNAVRKMALEHGLTISLHAPISDVNLMSPHPSAQALAEEELAATLSLASLIGATSITFHLGYQPPMGIPYEPPWEGAKRAIQRLGKKALGLGIKLCLENDPKLSGVYLWDLGCFRKILLELGIPGTLDLGHAWTAHGNETIRYLAGLVPLLSTVHLHDNHGELDEHLALGEGVVDFAQAWPHLSKVPLIVIEAKTQSALEQTLAQLRACLNRTGRTSIP